MHDSTAKNIHLHCFKSWQNVGGLCPPMFLTGGGGGANAPPSPPVSYTSDEYACSYKFKLLHVERLIEVQYVHY